MEKHKMRRKDREVNNIEEINAIISEAAVIRLGLYDGVVPYIVPMNFGFEFVDGVHLFYMHCANQGKKLDIIRKNSRCCYEIDLAYELKSAVEACGWTMNFKSVMGTGRIEILESADDKIHGLTILMKQYDRADIKQYDFSKLLAQTTVLRLASETISCKIKG